MSRAGLAGERQAVSRLKIAYVMKVRLIRQNAPDGTILWSLTLGRAYEVLGIEANDYRILDNTNEPYLFSHECFEVIEEREPTFWVSSVGDNGERYSYPAEWAVAGFFENYFDEVMSVRESFWRVVNERWPAVP